ncbi:unnamed protein product [Cylicocyclus nassatus]|uniref:Core-2/I-Branching enzyme n=1 Tax=Cylicocyclus nassatus TaxID=53992 RepID=A0AA36MAF7_CYLNA|nr:unnamed protein product [Cylicocyclus nassatus]
MYYWLRSMKLSKTKLYLWMFIIGFVAFCLYANLSFTADVPLILQDAQERLTGVFYSMHDKRQINYVTNILQFKSAYQLSSKIEVASVFRRKPETEHLSCGRILSGDEGYEFIEDELRASFHPQNIFCFSVDAKAENEFYSNIFALSICLPNVLISPMRYSIDSRGENMNQAHYDCLKLLSKHEGWQYAILLQNYDMMIKSVYETVSILEALNGANDIRSRPCEWFRWNHTANWNVRTLKLFHNESLATASQLATNLTIVRGIVQSSISRAAVDWAVNTVDLTTLINRINTRVYGTDELLWAILQMSDGLQMPGRFTEKCSKSYVPFITRYIADMFKRQAFGAYLSP